MLRSLYVSVFLKIHFLTFSEGVPPSVQLQEVAWLRAFHHIPSKKFQDAARKKVGSKALRERETTTATDDPRLISE